MTWMRDRLLVRLGVSILLGASAAIACGGPTELTDSSAEPGPDAGDPTGGGGDAIAPRCGGLAVAPEQLGVKVPIPDDPNALPDRYFEDQLFDPTGNLALWVPPGDGPVRGIFYAHGSGNRPSLQNVMEGNKWRDEVEQDRRLAERQMASNWGFAMLTGVTWLDDAHDYAQQIALLEQSLTFFAAETGHAELTTVPLVITGGSRYSEFGVQMAMDDTRPGRVIAAVSVVGGINANAASLRTPIVQIVGQDDGGQDKVNGSFFPARMQDAQVSAAMMWGVDHKCDACQDLGWIFLDQTICHRLGDTSLVDIPTAAGWRGDVDGWGAAAPAGQYPGDPLRAAWLPDAYVANVWAAFIVQDPPLTFTAPTHPYKWSDGFSQDPSSVKAGEPLTVRLTSTSLPAGDVTILDGDRPLGTATLDADGTTFVLADVVLDAGLHVFVAHAGGAPVARPAALLVLP